MFISVSCQSLVLASFLRREVRGRTLKMFYIKNTASKNSGWCFKPKNIDFLTYNNVASSSVSTEKQRVRVMETFATASRCYWLSKRLTFWSSGYLRAEVEFLSNVCSDLFYEVLSFMCAEASKTSKADVLLTEATNWGWDERIIHEVLAGKLFPVFTLS